MRPIGLFAVLGKNTQNQIVIATMSGALNLVWAVETARQVEEAKSKNKLPQELKLFLPIQCYNLKQFERFLYFLREENIEKFDGFSMPLRNLSMNESAKFVIRFYQLGIRRLHFLGVGNFKHIAFAAFLPKLLPELEWVSVDATSWYDPN